MIPYLDSINDADILAYWGHGSIFLKHKGIWNSYTLTDVDGDRCVISAQRGLCDSDAPPSIVMTREQFFEQCLLHRPPLGVVEDTDSGYLLHLSWTATGGDRVKAMLAEQVHIIRLAEYRAPDKPVEKTVTVPVQDDLVRWGTAFANLREELVTQGVAMYSRESRRRAFRNAADAGVVDYTRLSHTRKPAQPNIMSLVRRLLNRTEPTLKSACAEAKAHGSAAGPSGSWLSYDPTKDIYELYSGQTRLGRVRQSATGMASFTPVRYKNKAKSTSVIMLAKTILPEGEVK